MDAAVLGAVGILTEDRNAVPSAASATARDDGAEDADGGWEAAEWPPMGLVPARLAPTE